MKTKIIIIFAALLSFSFFHLLPSPIHAAVECELAEISSSPSSPQTYSANFCIGGFSTEQALRQQVKYITAECTDRSGFDKVQFNNAKGICGAEQQQAVTPGPVAKANDGYYTCFLVQNINRDVGGLKVHFQNNSQQNICSTPAYDIDPQNYTFLERYKRTIDSRNPFNPDQYNEGSLAGIKCADGGVSTALGCIPTNLKGDGFIKSILTLGIGIGGAIALILIVYGLFLITTSGGIPDKVNAGKEVITSAIAGLIFIIFSTILMNIIGINILGLPGLQ